jgi:hypothetical protein
LRELIADDIELETGRTRADGYILYLFPDAARFKTAAAKTRKEKVLCQKGPGQDDII